VSLEGYLLFKTGRGVKLGTRSDFYVGVGEKAEWIGSYAWDGNPGSIHEDIPLDVFVTEEDYRSQVKNYLAQHGGDATYPENGWPWPWEDSGTTDYAYMWLEGTVLISCFGSPLYTFKEEQKFLNELHNDDEEFEPKGAAPIFPNMKDRQNVRWDGGSGVIVISG
jgi:hypothetical protein